MPNFGAPEILLILLVILLLFGAKRLPDTARGLGRSLRIFKAETKGLRDDADEGTHAPRSATVARETSEPRIIERRPADAGSAVADDRFRDGRAVDERVTGQQPLTER